MKIVEDSGARDRHPYAVYEAIQPAVEPPFYAHASRPDLFLEKDSYLSYGMASPAPEPPSSQP